jgi:hypothetical protein
MLDIGDWPGSTRANPPDPWPSHFTELITWSGFIIRDTKNILILFFVIKSTTFYTIPSFQIKSNLSFPFCGWDCFNVLVLAGKYWWTDEESLHFPGYKGFIRIHGILSEPILVYRLLYLLSRCQRQLILGKWNMMRLDMLLEVTLFLK